MMYKKLLLELTKKIKWVKLGSSCSQSEIALAERAVGYPFPQELKDLLGEVNGDGGWALMSAKEIVETTDSSRLETFFRGRRKTRRIYR